MQEDLAACEDQIPVAVKMGVDSSPPPIIGFWDTWTGKVTLVLIGGAGGYIAKDIWGK